MPDVSSPAVRSATISQSPGFSATAISIHGFNTTAAFPHLKIGETNLSDWFPAWPSEVYHTGHCELLLPRDTFQFDASISSGNSGRPVL